MGDKNQKSNIEERKNVTVGNYNLGLVIGKGGFGTVYQGLDVENGDFVAIKQINLTKIPKDQLQGIMNEIDLLKNLNHPNIVKYIKYVKTKENLYIVLEYVENGSLQSIIKKFGKFPETLTPYWMAPEIIELNGATTKSDIWSVGCTVIELLTGSPPYYDLGQMPALFRIVQDDCPPLPEGISPALKDWLQQCFQKDPMLRISAQKLLKHKWILSSQKKAQPEEEPANIEDLAKNIQDYNERINQKKVSNHQRKPSNHPKSPKNKINLPPPEEDENEWGDDFSSTPKSIKLPDKKSPGGTPAKKPQQNQTPIKSPQPPSQPKSAEPLKLAVPKAAQPEPDEMDWGDDFDTVSDLSRALNLKSNMAAPKSDDEEDGFGDDFPTAIQLNSKLITTPPPSQTSSVDKKGIDQWGENKDEDWGDVATMHFDPKVVRKGSVNKPDLSSKFKNKSNFSIDNSNSNDDEDEDPFDFEDFDEDFDLDKNLLKDNYARMSEEILKLMNLLQPDQSEEVISGTCEQLITLFKENPEQKSLLIRRHGVIPIMEMLEVSNIGSNVLCSILKVVNQIIENNMEIQENLCLVGGIPAIMKFSGREYSDSVRLETASFVSKMCSTSTLTLQMFIACKGLPILVDFLSSSYSESKKLIWLAIDAIVNVFELQSPTPKNDFCRLFAKCGLLKMLPVVLKESLADVDMASKDYPDRLINLLIMFSSADSVVRKTMSSVETIRVILETLEDLPSEQLVKVLKSIRQISMDHNTLVNLQTAGTIRCLVPLLGRRNGAHIAEIHNQILNTMFHLCRIDAERQYQAAVDGIIPHLQYFIRSHSPLNQFALPIICDLAHSKKARPELWKNDGIVFYLDLLEERYWQVNALDSLSAWLIDETSAVEKIMAKPDSVKKLMMVFVNADGQSFAGILEPFLKIVNCSNLVNVALGTSNFIPKILDKITHTNPQVRLNLLKIITSLYECHPNSKKMIQEYKLYPIIQRIAETDKSVLVQKIASKLYEAFNANSVI
eukprot:gene5665-7051_t